MNGVGGIEYYSIAYPDTFDSLLVGVPTGLIKRGLYCPAIPRKGTRSLYLDNEIFDAEARQEQVCVLYLVVDVGKRPIQNNDKKVL